MYLNNFKIFCYNSSTSTSTSDFTMHNNNYSLVSENNRQEEEEVHSVDFNQDNSCVALGTSYGYRIFSINARYENGTPTGSINNNGSGNSSSTREMVEMLHSTKVTMGGGVIMARMLYCTSLLVLVYGKNPRMLAIEDASMKKVRCERSFGADIVRIELNRTRLAVFTADGMLQVFDMTSMKLLAIFSIVPLNNPTNALSSPESREPGRYFALSTITHSPLPGQSFIKNRNPWLVCRDPDCVGAVKVYNCNSMKMENIVKAHHHELSQIVIGTIDVAVSTHYQNEILATTSTKGTIIRIWSLPDCAPLCNLRRGMNASNIYSVAMNPQGSLLAVSSSSGTIHIFDISSKCIPALASETISSDQGSVSDSSTSSSTGQTKKSKLLRSHAKIRPWLGNKMDSKLGKPPRNTLAILPTDGNDKLIVRSGTCIHAFVLNNSKSSSRPVVAYDLLRIAKKEETIQRDGSAILDM